MKETALGTRPAQGRCPTLPPPSHALHQFLRRFHSPWPCPAFHLHFSCPLWSPATRAVLWDCCRPSLHTVSKACKVFSTALCVHADTYDRRRCRFRSHRYRDRSSCLIRKSVFARIRACATELDDGAIGRKQAAERRRLSRRDARASKLAVGDATRRGIPRCRRL